MCRLLLRGRNQESGEKRRNQQQATLLATWDLNPQPTACKAVALTIELVANEIRL